MQDKGDVMKSQTDFITSPLLQGAIAEIGLR